MAEKTLNTRILLKYDSYSNWTTKNPVLKAGEMAIATIASGNTQEVNSVTAPQVLIKVGDGTSAYNALPFVSAKAADVYGWAKAEKKPTYTADEIDGLSAYIAGEIEDTDTQYQIVKVDDYNYKLQSKAINGDWADVANGAIVIPKYDDAEVKADIEALEGLVGTTAVATQIANAISALDLANTYEAKGTAATEAGKALDNAKAYTDEEIAGLDLEIVENAINIKNKAGTVVATVDATKFVKDGMLTNAAYNTETNKLTLTWNTDAGITATDIDLNDLVDTYTGGKGINVATNGEISIDEDVVAVIGTSDDASSVDSIKGAKKYADEKVAELANGAVKANTDAIGDMVWVRQTMGVYNLSSAIATNYEAIQNTVTREELDQRMLTVASQDYVDTYFLNKNYLDEELADYAKTADLAAIAKTGNVNDLVQTSGDVLIFNCGDSTNCGA